MLWETWAFNWKPRRPVDFEPRNQGHIDGQLPIGANLDGTLRCSLEICLKEPLHNGWFGEVTQFAHTGTIGE